ncbi:MAG: ankyrin repeat domain-containing protein [Caulobacter sp.]|nr:ankyrin repeat domain-containing protein [Caulobacter sp.]
MAKAKKKLLPKDFDALLRDGDLDQLKAVFNNCEIDARGGYTKRTALASHDCPDALARWLVEQGADIEATDSYGETPLHSRAGHWQKQPGVLLELGANVSAKDSRGNTPLHYAARVGNTATMRLLLDRGAEPGALNARGQTPLSLALTDCSNAVITRLPPVAELLLPMMAPAESGLRGLAGRLFGGRAATPVTPEMQAAVTRIGNEFEFHRAGYNPESVDEASAALDRLYALFEVPPVPRRTTHAGDTPIIARAADWQDCHQELWQLLVPSSGAAATVQGEVIRISGRMHIEIEENGGVNWNADYRKMGRALLGYIASGRSLPQAGLTLAAKLVHDVRTQDGAPAELCRLAVEWVALNPSPLALPQPDYAR